MVRKVLQDVSSSYITKRCDADFGAASRLFKAVPLTPLLVVALSDGFCFNRLGIRRGGYAVTVRIIPLGLLASLAAATVLSISPGGRAQNTTSALPEVTVTAPAPKAAPPTCANPAVSTREILILVDIGSRRRNSRRFHVRRLASRRSQATNACKAIG